MDVHVYPVNAPERAPPTVLTEEQFRQQPTRLLEEHRAIMVRATGVKKGLQLLTDWLDGEPIFPLLRWNMLTTTTGLSVAVRAPTASLLLVFIKRAPDGRWIKWLPAQTYAYLDHLDRTILPLLDAFVGSPKEMGPAYTAPIRIIASGDPQASALTAYLRLLGSKRFLLASSPPITSWPSH